MNRATTFVSNMLWGQVGRMSELVLGFLFNLAVIRQLTVGEYGAYSIIINLVGTINYFSALGLSESLTRFVPLAISANPPYHFSLLRRFLWLRLFIGTGLGISLVVAGGWLAQIFNAPEIAQFGWMLPLLILSFSLIDLFLNFYIASFRLRETAWARPLVQLFSLLAILGWFWWFSPGLLAVLIVTLISNGIMCAFYLLRLPPKLLLTASSLPETGADSKAIRNYSRDLWFTSLCTFGLSGWTDIIIIGIVLADQNQVAYYALVMMLLSRVSAFATGWVGSMNSIAATVQMEKGEAGLSRYFLYFYKLNLIAHIIFLGYFIACGSALIISLFTVRYEPSILILWAYSGFWLTFGLFGGAIAQTFGSILGKQNVILRSRFAISTLNLVLEVILLYWLGLIGAVIATLIANFLTHIVELYFIRRIIKQVPVRFILKISVVTAVAAIAGWWVASNTFIGLFVSSLVYAVVWFGGLLLVKPLDSNDKQVLLNWRPSLTKILKYF